MSSYNDQQAIKELAALGLTPEEILPHVSLKCTMQDIRRYLATHNDLHAMIANAR
jgi:hypothetical protein